MEKPPPDIDLSADQGPRIVASQVVLIVLPTLFVIARLISRWLARAGFWWDDVWVLVTLILTYGVCTVVLVSKDYNGLGRHIWALPDPPHNTMIFLKLLYAYSLLYRSAVCAMKASMLFFYRRIFPVRKILWTIYATGAVVMCYWIIIVFLVLFQCNPPDRYWLRTKPGYCLNGDLVLLVTGSINCVLDFWIIFLPIPLITRLRTTHSQKTILTLIFLSAGFVLIISIYRLVVLGRLHNADLTWNYVPSAIWSAAEPSMGVIAACLPSLRPLISLIVRGTVKGVGVSGSKGGTGTGTMRLGSLGGGMEKRGKRLGSASEEEFVSLGGGRGREGSQVSNKYRLGGAYGDDLEGQKTPERPGPARGATEERKEKMGHEVQISGRDRAGGNAGAGGRRGAAGEDDSMEEVDVPMGGMGMAIHVRDEVTVVSSRGGLEYKDKIF